MIRAGAGSKLASEMGHLPLSGPHGLLALLKHYPRPRKILIHINNTNPILDENTAERALLAAQDVEVAWDGMDIEC
jgi:pyrroloquinoline quinone biosynthesis protein B